MSLDPVRVLDFALGMLVVEVVVLAWRTRDPRLRGSLLSFLGAGGSLLLAARVSLAGGPTPWFYALLALGGMMQAWHLRHLRHLWSR